MFKPYLIMVNGTLAERCLTGTKALRRVRELKEKGYKDVCIAYDVEKKISIANMKNTGYKRMEGN
jgi:hypothetical protein